MVEGVERSALDLGALLLGRGAWAAGGRLPPAPARALLADVLHPTIRMKMFDGMLNLTFLLLSLI